MQSGFIRAVPAPVRTMAATLAVIGALGFAGIANAITIDIEQGAATGGTLQNDINGAWGTDIVMTVLKVVGVPLNSGLYDIQSGDLDFDTRAGNNFITLTGGVSSLGINDVNTVLLSGSFDSHSYTPGTIEVFQGSGPDTKSSALLSSLGIDPGTPFEFFSFAIESSEGTVTSADIINTAVPIPAAAWLFGSGLLGLIGISRKKIAA